MDILTDWAKKAQTTPLEPRKLAFLQEYGPYAKRYGALWNIDPEILLGWGASESNFGAAGSIFGVKQWDASKKSQVYDTWEMVNGQRVDQKAAFEVYDSPDEAFQALGNLLNTERYRPAFERVKQTGDSAGFMREINDAGYATDKNWANSVVALANSFGQGQFPDPPPPSPGKITSTAGSAMAPIVPGQRLPVEEQGIRGQVARLVVQKRLDAQQARDASVDESARAKLEVALNQPMPDISSERVTSSIKPPGAGDEGLASTGGMAGSTVGSMFGAPPGAAEKKASLMMPGREGFEAQRRANEGGTGMIGQLAPVIKGVYDASNYVKDVPVDAIPGVGTLARPGLAALGEKPTVGGLWGADLPGMKKAREAVSEVEGAHLLNRTGIPQKLGIDLPSAGDVLSQGIPTTFGAAATNTIGAKGLVEVFTGIPGLDDLVNRAGRGIRVPGTKVAAADALKQTAKAAEQAAKDKAKTLRPEGDGVAALGARPSSGIQRAPLGKGAKEEAYGAIVRDASQKMMSPEAAGNLEAGLIKTGSTWADHGHRVETLAPEKAPWLREPASASVSQGTKSVNPDGSINFDALKSEVKSSVADVREARAGNDTRSQMERARARPAIGGENSMLGKNGSQLGRDGKPANPVSADEVAFGREPGAEGEAAAAGMREVAPDEKTGPSNFYRKRAAAMSTEDVRAMYARTADRLANSPEALAEARRIGFGGEREVYSDISRSNAAHLAAGEELYKRTNGAEGIAPRSEMARPPTQLSPSRLHILEDKAVKRMIDETLEHLANDPSPANQLKLDSLRQQLMDEAERRNLDLATGRPKTQWTVTNKAGEARQVDTLGGARSASPEEAQATYEAAKAEAERAGVSAEGARRLGLAQQAQNGIKKLKDIIVGQPDLPGVVARADGIERVVPGLPKSIQTEAGWASKVQSVAEQALRGAAHKFWYSLSSEEIMRMAKGNIQDADVIARIAATGSNKNTVGAQGQWILESYRAYKEGRLTRVSPMYDISKRADSLVKMSNEDFDQYIIDMIQKGDNQKVTNFYLDLMQGIDPARTNRLREASGATSTVDAWMMRAFGFAETEYKSPTAAQYRRISSGIQDIADKLTRETGEVWEPKQVQAAIWVQYMFEHPELKGIAKDPATNYADSLLRHAGRLRQEAVPAASDPLYDGVKAAFDNAPPEARAAHAMDVHLAHLDEQGNDIIAKLTDTPVGADGRPLAGGAASGANGGLVDPAQADNISLWAGLRAKAEGKGKTSWLRPFNGQSAGHHNTLDISIGRQITLDDLDNLRNELPGLEVLPGDNGGATVFRQPDDQDYLARRTLPSEKIDLEKDSPEVIARKEAKNAVATEGNAASKAAFAEVTKTNKKLRADVEEAMRRVFPDDETGKVVTYATDGRIIDVENDSNISAALERPSIRAGVDTVAGRIGAARGTFIDSWGPNGTQLAERAERGAAEFPGAAAVPGSAVPTGQPASGASSLRQDVRQLARGPEGATGLSAAKSFEFVDPFNPTPDELNRFTEIGGSELLAEANRLDQLSMAEGGLAGEVVENAHPLIADLVTLAKRLGDPGGELRRQLQQNGILGAPKDQQSSERRPPAFGPGAGVMPNVPAPTGTPKRGPAGQLLHELTSLPGGIAGAMRTGFASGDLPVARQGGAFVRDPQQLVKSTGNAIQAYASENFADTAKAAREADPLYQESVSAGIKYRQAGVNAAPGTKAANFDWMNDSFISKLVNKIPYVERSERGTVEFLNDIMFETYKSVTGPMFAAGIKDEKAYEAVADVINHMAGHSGSNMAEAWGKFNALFSAQYTFSRFNLLADPMSYYRYPDARNLALQSLGALGGGNLALAAMAKVTGKSTGLWDVNLDPEASDFGQVRIGNTRYDFLAGFGPMLKTGAKIQAHTRQGIKDGAADEDFFNQIVADVGKYFENKEAPVMKILTDSYIHKSAPELKELLKNMAPGIATGMIDTYSKNEGTARGLNVGLGAVLTPFSVGQNTYSTADDKADDIAKKVGGKKFAELDTTGKLKVLGQMEDADRKARGGPAEVERKAYKQVLTDAGIREKPKEGETKTEEGKRLKANADVYENLPADQKAQRWFWDNASPDTKEALDKVLELDALDKDGKPREVKLSGTQRNLNTDKGKELWKATGKPVADYFSEDYVAKKHVDLADYYAQRSSEAVPYAKLSLEKKKDVAGTVRARMRETDAGIDALLAYYGYGGNNNKYTVQSQAAAANLEKLRAKYGREPARDDYKFAIKAEAK